MSTHHSISRWGLGGLVWSLVASIGLAEEPAGQISTDVQRFVATYCLQCHGAQEPEGDFRVDKLQVSRNAAEAENWQLVLDNLLLGEMPPEEAKQPLAHEVERVTAWIQRELSQAATRLKGTGGEVVLRRLNRTEYQHTIADLFDVHGDFTSGFPDDMRADGYDNNGGALMLSASQIQEYLKAADFVLARAIAPEKQPEVRKVTFTLHDLNREATASARQQLENRLAKFKNLTPREQQNTRDSQAEAAARPASYGYRFPVLENGELRLPEPGDGPPLDAVMTVQRYFSGEPQTNKRFAIRQPGWYRVQAEAYPLKNEGKPVRLKFTVGKPSVGVLPKAESIFALTDGQPQRVEGLYYMEPGDRVVFTMADGSPHKQGRDYLDQPGPFIAIRSLSMEGPIYDAWPPKGHRTLFGELDASQLSAEDVEVIVARLAPQLFRRPVEAATLTHYRGLFERLSQTMPPAESVRGMLAAMLVSPRFLYHEEPPTGPDAYAIASRMSYFLWRSTPDDELLQAAADGRLLQAEGRREQAHRMIADRRVERFLTDFTGQWLRVREVGVMRANPDLYPEYDLELEAAIRGETEHFMAEMFRRDLPLSQLIDSDWTMLNERLAKHYGIAGVVGPDFRRVSLDKAETVRGGLLTHASIHAVTSNGTVTSPVTRGIWVLEKLLGMPPPPPPPDVPPIEPDIRGATTIQEQLAKHRSLAACHACHAKIDPPGFALENFDVIGGWRTNYRALTEATAKARPKLIDGPPIEANGDWGAFGRFSSFVEFRELLKEREQRVIENVAHQLATFALGRKPGFTDREPLQQLAKRSWENASGLKTLVVELISGPVLVNP
jgi:hypothetical protein